MGRAPKVRPTGHPPARRAEGPQQVQPGLLALLRLRARRPPLAHGVPDQTRRYRRPRRRLSMQTKGVLLVNALPILLRMGWTGDWTTAEHERLMGFGHRVTSTARAVHPGAHLDALPEFGPRLVKDGRMAPSHARLLHPLGR